MKERFHEMTIAGCTRKLPICKVNDAISIAAFIMFSDVEVTVASAAELLKKAPEFDVIVTAEAKSIPLIYEMSRQSGKPHIICRKASKIYMTQPIKVEVKSITTANVQTLYLDQTELEFLKGKKVLIADDVISTGGSLMAIETLLNKTECEIVGKCAVLAEGEAADRDDIFYLEVLPVFDTKDYFD